MAADPDEAFVLTVDDVFELTGVGTVVVGDIVSGVLRNGEAVEIHENGAVIATSRADIMFACRPGTDPASRPGLTSLALPDVTTELLRSGQVVRRATEPGGSPC